MKIHTNPAVLVDNTHGLRFTESPRWHRGRFWFLDIHAHAIRSVGLQGDLRTEVQLPFRPNGLGIRADGSLVLGDSMRFRICRWQEGRIDVRADLTGNVVFRLSDGILDAQDRFYIGDIGFNFLDPTQQPVDTCVIACVAPDGTARVVARGLKFPNGMALTPDGRTLIVAESRGTRLSAFDVLPDGSLANRRVFAELPEGVRPDGIALDTEGCVWLANPAGGDDVLRVREGGEILERVRLDSHAYAVALGGPQRRHLLICASDTHNSDETAVRPSATLRLIEVDVPGAGLP
jgi:sugar lactone lactonase YvrE